MDAISISHGKTVHIKKIKKGKIKMENRGQRAPCDSKQHVCSLHTGNVHVCLFKFCLLSSSVDDESFSLPYVNIIKEL